jgi:hypothetical protein
MYVSADGSHSGYSIREAHFIDARVANDYDFPKSRREQRLLSTERWAVVFLFQTPGIAPVPINPNVKYRYDYSLVLLTRIDFQGLKNPDFHYP